MKGNLESSKFSKGNATPAKRYIHQFLGLLSLNGSMLIWLEKLICD